jgi:hypothetical protein
MRDTGMKRVRTMWRFPFRADSHPAYQCKQMCSRARGLATPRYYSHARVGGHLRSHQLQWLIYSIANFSQAGTSTGARSRPPHRGDTSLRATPSWRPGSLSARLPSTAHSLAYHEARGLRRMPAHVTSHTTPYPGYAGRESAVKAQYTAAGLSRFRRPVGYHALRRNQGAAWHPVAS